MNSENTVPHEIRMSGSGPPSLICHGLATAVTGRVRAIQKNRFMPATGSGFAATAMTKNLTASKNRQAMPRPGFA
jgi:hypothetical protein